MCRSVCIIIYRKDSNYSPKKIIQDTTYNVRRESEFICTLMENSAYWRFNTLGWQYNSSLYGRLHQVEDLQTTLSSTV